MNTKIDLQKKFVATGLAAGLVAGAGAGLILQSSGFAGAGSPAAVAVVTPDDTTTDATTDATTDTTTGTEREVAQAERLAEVLAPLVEGGTITADQSTAVVDALVAAGPLGGGRDGRDGRDGRGGRDGRDGRGGRGGRGGGGANLEALTSVLNMTAEEIHTALHDDGATLATIAAAQGVEVDAVVDALLTAATTRIDDDVAAGDLTQAEADERRAGLEARITDIVNNGRPERGQRDAAGT